MRGMRGSAGRHASTPPPDAHTLHLSLSVTQATHATLSSRAGRDECIANTLNAWCFPELEPAANKS